MNVTVTSNRTISIALDEIVGSFRTFGASGPTYEVLRVVGPDMGPDVRVEIRVIESGEVLSYRLSDAVSDPLAP
jgi:hypothetical protein